MLQEEIIQVDVADKIGRMTAFKLLLVFVYIKELKFSFVTRRKQAGILIITTNTSHFNGYRSFSIQYVSMRYSYALIHLPFFINFIDKHIMYLLHLFNTTMYLFMQSWITWIKEEKRL